MAGFADTHAELQERMKILRQEGEEDVRVRVGEVSEVGVHVLLGHRPGVPGGRERLPHLFADGFSRRHEVAVAELRPLLGLFMRRTRR